LWTFSYLLPPADGARCVSMKVVRRGIGGHFAPAPSEERVERTSSSSSSLCASTRPESSGTRGGDAPALPKSVARSHKRGAGAAGSSSFMGGVRWVDSGGYVDACTLELRDGRRYGGDTAAACETQRQGRCSSATASVTDPMRRVARCIPIAGKSVVGYTPRVGPPTT
jgi:hypothetical protein